METSCPECGQRYDLGALALAPGRTVRCARCRATWMPGGAATARPPDEGGEPLRSSRDDTDARRVSGDVSGATDFRAALDAAPDWPLPPPGAQMALGRGGGRSPAGLIALTAAWSVSAVVLVAAVWAFLHFRHAIETAWPPTLRLYRLLGVRRHG